MYRRLIVCIILGFVLVVVLPAPAHAQVCAGFTSELTQGSTARALSTLNLRQSANPDSAVLGQIPAGAEFIVTGGPLCANNTTFWTVVYAGRNGWAAEGESDQRFAVLAATGTGDTSLDARGALSLPATGETPWWRNWIIAAATGLVITMLAGAVVIIMRRFTGHPIR